MGKQAFNPTGHVIKEIIDRRINELEYLGLKPKAILLGGSNYYKRFQNEMIDKMESANKNLDTCDTTFVIETYRGLPIKSTDMSIVAYNFVPGFVSPVQVTVESYELKDLRDDTE